MLTFLRKIRRSIIGSSSFRKHLPYTIGEILLVMIGILLAMQVNNWNEERKTQRQLKALISNLIETVNDDIRWFDRIWMVNSFRAQSLTYVLNLVGESPKIWDAEEKNPMFNFKDIQPPESNAIWNEPYPDTLNHKLLELSFLWSQRPLFMVPNKTVIDELKSTGLLSHIRNLELKNKINAYYNELEFQYSDIRDEYQNAIVLSWLDVLRKYGIQAIDVYSVGNPIQIIKDNKEISNFMKEIIDAAQTRMQLAGSNKRDASRLLDALLAELDK